MSLRRIARWIPIDGAGLEHLEIAEQDDAIHIRSALIGDKDEVDYGILYEMMLDPDWTFRSLSLRRMDGKTMMLTSDRQGNWFGDSNLPRRELEGCIDIDISGTPFTNTLPMRRNRDWVIGEPRRFDMAWVPLDTLEPFKDGQIYTPLGGEKWRYQAADGSFEAEITVDENGLVLDYPGLFRRAK
ncbi:MAG TPA: putative glycolipid-binding domain-containing protein [Tepidiformaceae bacterium]|nr:putative glycolipid-binding domain-containing protein [Tepidiformaceae bacterium]